MARASGLPEEPATGRAVERARATGLSRKTVPDIETARSEGYRWLDEVCEALGTSDRNYALLALRAVLHALRDRLTLEQSAHFSGHLPVLLGGIYFDDWNPNARPTRDRTAGEFAQRVSRSLPDFSEREASRIVAAIFDVFQRNLIPDDCKHGAARRNRDLAAEWELRTP